MFSLEGFNNLGACKNVIDAVDKIRRKCVKQSGPFTLKCVRCEIKESADIK